MVSVVFVMSVSPYSGQSRQEASQWRVSVLVVSVEGVELVLSQRRCEKNEAGAALKLRTNVANTEKSLIVCDCMYKAKE